MTDDAVTYGLPDHILFMPDGGVIHPPPPPPKPLLVSDSYVRTCDELRLDGLRPGDFQIVIDEQQLRGWEGDAYHRFWDMNGVRGDRVRREFWKRVHARRINAMGWPKAR